MVVRRCAIVSAAVAAAAAAAQMYKPKHITFLSTSLSTSSNILLNCHKLRCNRLLWVRLQSNMPQTQYCLFFVVHTFQKGSSRLSLRCIEYIHFIFISFSWLRLCFCPRSAIVLKTEIAHRSFMVLCKHSEEENRITALLISSGI